MSTVIHVQSKENKLNEMPISASYEVEETEDLIIVKIEE